MKIKNDEVCWSCFGDIYLRVVSIIRDKSEIISTFFDDIMCTLNYSYSTVPKRSNLDSFSKKTNGLNEKRNLQMPNVVAKNRI